MISIFKKAGQHIEFICSFPALPVACPVCGQRDSVSTYIINILCINSMNLWCKKCKVVFSKNRPQDYVYTPEKQHEIAEESMLRR
ncbi:MAG: hypothetical protein ACKUBY_05525 [Candidatus Moraniibacteriota bacterium]|jgi:hypothetical protein